MVYTWKENKPKRERKNSDTSPLEIPKSRRDPRFGRDRESQRRIRSSVDGWWGNSAHIRYRALDEGFSDVVSGTVGTERRGEERREKSRREEKRGRNKIERETTTRRRRPTFLDGLPVGYRGGHRSSSHIQRWRICFFLLSDPRGEAFARGWRCGRWLQRLPPKGTQRRYHLRGNGKLPNFRIVRTCHFAFLPGLWPRPTTVDMKLSRVPLFEAPLDPSSPSDMLKQQCELVNRARRFERMRLRLRRILDAFLTNVTIVCQ